MLVQTISRTIGRMLNNVGNLQARPTTTVLTAPHAFLASPKSANKTYNPQLNTRLGFGFNLVDKAHLLKPFNMSKHGKQMSVKKIMMI